MITSLKRVIKAGFVNFWRNFWVSFATILIMVLALFMIGSIVFSRSLLFSVLEEIESKVDISVYFVLDAEESDIKNIQESIFLLSEVESVEYISKANALAIFEERHRENALLTSSLEELGANPFGASLNIRAHDPSQYETVALFLEQGNFPSIEKVNYRKNKIVIDRLANIINASRDAGVGISLVLSFIAMLVVFNTIRLAIFSSREEIQIEELVGASSWYIRMPFLVEGFLHGLIASIVTMLIFWPLTLWLGPKAQFFFGGFNLYTYYVSNLLQFFFILASVGVVLGALSSFIATRRYLKV
ncbi:cell division protein FtsX [Patescibacteria group bacterium]